IDRVPPAARTADLNNFRDRILSRATEDKAKALNEKGDREGARRLLAALYTDPHVLPDERRIAAYDLYKMGDREAALQLTGEAARSGGPGATKAAIDHAKLLVTDKRYAEAEAAGRPADPRPQPRRRLRPDRSAAGAAPERHDPVDGDGTDFCRGRPRQPG